MIIIIDNYDSFTYNLYQLTAQFYKEIKVFRNDESSVDEIRSLNPKAIILSPGPSRPEKAGICIDLIKQLTNTPILGVCLGHQAIGVAFGGKVIESESIYHGKPDLIFHYRKLLYKEMPLPFKAGRYHSLIVDKDTLPFELVIESESADGIIMGMRHKERPVFGVQFHPESILTPLGNHIIKNFLTTIQ